MSLWHHSLRELANPPLYRLYLYENRLSGTVPPAIYVKPKLGRFLASNNMLRGTLPPTVSAAMKWLWLADNQLSGSVPPSIWNSGLESVLFSGNRFSGRLTDEIGNAFSLTELGIHSNLFSGSVPLALGNLTRLSSLRIAHNRFSGTLPSGLLGPLSAVQVLDVSNNLLTGALPRGLRSARSLSTVIASNNPWGIHLADLLAPLFERAGVGTSEFAVDGCTQKMSPACVDIEVCAPGLAGPNTRTLNRPIPPVSFMG